MQLKFLLAALASTLPFQAAAQVFPTGIVGGEVLTNIFTPPKVSHVKNNP